MRILWATKTGAADWEEQLLTEREELIPAARAWAEKNGFDRFRVSEVADAPEKPDFVAAVLSRAQK